MNQEITVLAAKVIQLEHLLQRYGPEADGERDLLHLYAALKLQNLFPQGKTKPVLENPRTIILFEETTGPVGGKGRPQRTAALAAVAGPGADQRYGGSEVAFVGAKNPHFTRKALIQKGFLVDSRRYRARLCDYGV